LRAAAAGLVFEPDDLAAIIAPLSLDDLEPLILEAGTRAFDEDGLGEGMGEAWPLLRFDKKLVLARPLGLALALNHRMLLRAVDEIGEESLAAAYSSQVVDDVLRSLRRMGIDASQVSGGELVELRARIDTGVELLCLVFSDDMHGLGADPYAEVRNPPAVAAATERIEDTAAAAQGELFVLFAAQSGGRPFFYGVRKAEAANVVFEAIQASDLDTFAILEPRDPLTLWKFARAMDPLQEARRGR
jgi:hypothetical protein